MSMENLLTEIEVMKELDHPHIVKLKDFEVCVCVCVCVCVQCVCVRVCVYSVCVHVHVCVYIKTAMNLRRFIWCIDPS